MEDLLRVKANMLIMEDDVILKEEKKHELKNEINELLMLDADYIDLGGGAGLHPTEGWPFTKEEKKQDVYVVSTNSTRTTCAYLIRKQLAIDLLKLKEPILFPIDIQLTYLFQCIEAKVLWPRDELFIHGSEHGYYNNKRTVIKMFERQWLKAKSTRHDSRIKDF